jgi:hypothetical protein
MRSYGLGTMPYRDWFCSAEGVRPPGGLPGWHLGWYLNLVIAEVGFSPRNMACYDDFAMLWMRKNLERKI